MILQGKLTKQEAAHTPSITTRTIDRYLHRFQEEAPHGLYDSRHSNYHKIDKKKEEQIVSCKTESPHRSTRLIRDILGLPVHEETVRRFLVKHNLERASPPPSEANPPVCGSRTE
jgi:transposase